MKTGAVLHTVLPAAAALVIALADPALSIEQKGGVSATIEGGRGLMYMQTARTFGKGAFVAGVKGFALEKEISAVDPLGRPMKKTDLPVVLAVPVTFGLTDEIDLTASFYGFHDGRGWLNPRDFTEGYGDPETGAGASKVGVKIRLPFSLESRIQVAGKFAAVLDTSIRQLDGMNYRLTRTGTDIETSLYESFDITQFMSLHFEQGFVLSGSDYFDDQVVGAAGIEMHPAPWLTITCEVNNRTFAGKGPQSLVEAGANPSRYDTVNGQPAVGNPLHVKDSKKDYDKDFFIVTPSMSFRLNKYLSFDIGVNVNIADQKSPKERYQVVGGLTFATRIKAFIDTDSDGIRNNRDIEPETPYGYPIDSRGRALDTDRDGVPDGADLEQDTPLGARINDSGVGIDTDGDGVYDGLDMDPRTPYGCPVDKFGVALDDDRDGVPNGIDLEPDTVMGAVVKENGVALDEDGDGIPNGLDMEPSSPRGAVVDNSGVALDEDGDGVPNGLDQESNTPQGILVDKTGRALIKQEFSLLREGLIRLNTIYYEGGTAGVPQDADHVIDEIGRIMIKYPTLRIQIEGHTDSTGDPAINMRLARERARNVLEALIQRYPTLSRDRLRVVGFGSDKPVASNKTFEGRRTNRRVEFVIINREEGAEER